MRVANGGGGHWGVRPPPVAAGAPSPDENYADGIVCSAQFCLPVTDRNWKAKHWWGISSYHKNWQGK